MTLVSGPYGSRTSAPMAGAPPRNLCLVEVGVYRSAYPTEANVPYLRQIGIRTVVLLSVESLPASVTKALREGADKNAAASTPHTAPGKRGGEAGQSDLAKGMLVVEVADIESWRVDSLNNRDDFSHKDVMRALDFAIDKQWHPVLLCCPTGELQTSVVVGCMRRYQGWSLSSIFCECELFATLQTSLRLSLMCFIESWCPEDFPVSSTDIASRNREWSKEIVNMAQQQRKMKRRVLRQQQHQRHHHDHGDRDFLRRGQGRHVGAAAAAEEPGSSSDDEGDTNTDASVQSSIAAPTGGPETREGSTPVVAVEGSQLTGTGLRPPSAWRRRRPPTAGSERGSEQTDSHAHGADTLPMAATESVACHSDVTFADWFVAARLRNHVCCADAFPDHHDGDISTCVAWRGSGTDFAFPAVDRDGQREVLPPPHIIYAAVRNPPVLDQRSTFTKESTVDEDDD